MISIRWLLSESFFDGRCVRMAKEPGSLWLRTHSFTYVFHDPGGSASNTGITPQENNKSWQVFALGLIATVHTGSRNAESRRTDLPPAVRANTAAGFRYSMLDSTLIEMRCSGSMLRVSSVSA